MIRTKDFIIDEKNILYVMKKDCVEYYGKTKFGISIALKNETTATPYYDSMKDRDDEFEKLWKELKK